MGRLIWSGNDGESKTMCKKYPINTIAICGQTATGKNFIVNKLLEYYPHKLNRIVSYTTRPPRANEVDGVDYHFITEEEFKKSIEDNEFLEWKVFNNWYYGTSLDSLSKDKINIGVFNPAGIRSLLQHPEAEVIVFKIFCGDKNRLLRQLNRESNPNVDEIIRRYYADKEDFTNLEFEYTLFINETSKHLKENVKKLQSVVYDMHWA